MITKTKHRAALGRTIVFRLLLAKLLAMLVSMVPAGAALTWGTAFARGYNNDSQLGNGTSGRVADSDGGYVHTLAVTW